MKRRLAAILAADVAGFTRHIAQDEEAALAALEKLMQETVSLHVEAQRGRIFKTLGDGILAEFTSTIESVKCAIGIQNALHLAPRTSGEGEPMLLRIGVSVGDVVVQDTDLLGDGVNMAARLQAMAEPGGIAVSGEVMNQIKGKIDLEFEDQGFKKLKDHDAPVHVYRSSRAAARASGMFDFDDQALDSNRITGGCLCGAVRFEIDQPAISTGYCHCRICQKFTGSAMSTWTVFPATAVRFQDKRPRYFFSSLVAERGFCPECGSSLTYRLIKPEPAKYIVIFTTSLDHPEDYAPAVHGGIESKLPWLEILDDLPRTTCPESRSLQEAWGAVGLTDPQVWKPKKYTPS